MTTEPVNLLHALAVTTDQARANALRSARSASQTVRDDALRAEVILLRSELADMRTRFEASQLVADQAIRERDRAINTPCMECGHS